MTALGDGLIAITLDGITVELRPTLRAALRIARRHGDYNQALRLLGEGHLATIVHTIEEGAEDKTSARALIAHIDDITLMRFISFVAAPLMGFVLALAFTGETKAADAPDAKPATWTALHEQLFAIGTGVLGWTPEETWRSTPAEIVAAHGARMNLLNAIFGGKQKDTDLTLDEKADRLFAGRRQKANTDA